MKMKLLITISALSIIGCNTNMGTTPIRPDGTQWLGGGIYLDDNGKWDSTAIASLRRDTILKMTWKNSTGQEISIDVTLKAPIH